MQIGGLASGIDTVGLVDQLMSLERRPITLMNDKKSTLQKQKDTWRDINTRLSTLLTKIKDLQNSSAFHAQKTSSTDEKIATANSSGGSVTGTYNLEVISMATSSRVSSGGTLSNPIARTQPLNSSGLGLAPTSGNFSINGVSVNVDVTTESMDDIIAKINGTVPDIVASYDAINDKFQLTSTIGSSIQLGSGADSSNFLSATRVLSTTQVGNSITSGSKLGSTKIMTTLDNSRLVNAFSNSTGTFSINGVEFNYDTATDTLDSIMKRVNESSANVSMSYDSISDKISMQSKNTGSIDIALSDLTGNFLNAIQLNTGVKTFGQNARFKISSINGGQELTSSSNSVAGVIEGLTLELKAVGQTSIGVNQDVDSTLGKIKAFVEQYNSVQDFISTKLVKGEILQGDATLMRVQSSLRSKTTGLVGGITTDFKLLADIGIDSERKGTLKIDESKLKKAIENKGFSIHNLFNSTEGIGTKLQAEVDSLIKSSTGLITEKQKSYDNLIKDINDRVKIMEERIERRRETLLRQFTAMEKAISKASNQGMWLDSQLTQINSWSGK